MKVNVKTFSKKKGAVVATKRGHGHHNSGHGYSGHYEGGYSYGYNDHH